LALYIKRDLITMLSIPAVQQYLLVRRPGSSTGHSAGVLSRRL
jgi:hypothetical protein